MVPCHQMHPYQHHQSKGKNNICTKPPKIPQNIAGFISLCTTRSVSALSILLADPSPLGKDAHWGSQLASLGFMCCAAPGENLTPRGLP